jgi:polyhydroxyalkanoate synthesis regulator protein
MAQAQVVITGVDRTQGAINSAMKGLRGLGDQASVLKRAFAGIGAVAVGQFLVRTASAAIQYGDELQKASVKSGVAVEQLSALAYAAKQSDIDLGSLSESLKKMQLALSQATTGGKEQKKTLDALGISLEDIKDLNADEQFILIAQQISSLKSPTDKARAATELFGRAGANLLPLFEEGAEGIRILIEESDRLSLKLSSEQVKALSDADDAVKRLSTSYDMFSTKLVAKVAPALTNIFDVLSGAKGEFTLFPGFEEKSMMLMGGGGKSTISAEALAKGNAAFEKERERLAKEGKNVDGRAEGYKDSENAIKALEQVTIKSARNMDTAMQTFYKNLSTTAFASFDDQIRKFAETEAALNELFQSQKISSSEFVNAWDVAFNELQNSFKDIQDSIDPLVVAEKFDRFGQLLNSFSSQNKAVAEEIKVAYNNALDAILPGVQITSKKVVPELSNSMKAMNEFARTAASNMQNAFAQFLFDPFKDGLRGMLSNFVNMLRQMVAQIVAQQILLSFFRMFTSGTGFMANFANAAVSEIEGRAVGGPVSQGTPYMVGERGPELFVPNSSGSIVPNNRMGGVTVAPVYNIDARGATADLQQALPGILKENNRRIFDELDRRYGIGR